MEQCGLSEPSIEHIKKFEKNKGELKKKAREKGETVVHELMPSRERGYPDSDTQWRADILLGRKRLLVAGGSGEEGRAGKKGTSDTSVSRPNDAKEEKV